jgi:hypothetical protein
MIWCAQTFSNFWKLAEKVSIFVFFLKLAHVARVLSDPSSRGRQLELEAVAAVGSASLPLLMLLATALRL